MCASRKCLFERKLLRNEWKRKWCKNWHRVSHVWYRSPLFLKKKSMTSKNPCILSFRATRPSRHRSFLLFCFFSGIPSLINGIQFCVHAVHMMIGEQQQQKKKIKTNEIQIIIAPISAKHLKFIGSNHSGFFSIYTLHCVCTQTILNLTWNEMTEKHEIENYVWFSSWTFFDWFYGEEKSTYIYDGLTSCVHIEFEEKKKNYFNCFFSRCWLNYVPEKFTGTDQI